MKRESGVPGFEKVQKAEFSTLFGPEMLHFAFKSSIYYCNITAYPNNMAVR